MKGVSEMLLAVKGEGSSMSNVEKNAEILALLDEKELEAMTYIAFGLKLREIESICNDKSNSTN